jgi:hypothetical protein
MKQIRHFFFNLRYPTTLLGHCEDGGSSSTLTLIAIYQSMIWLRKPHISQFKKLKEHDLNKQINIPVFTQINTLIKHIEEGGNFLIKIFPPVHQKQELSKWQMSI